MKIIKLTSKEVREIMPTECSLAENRGEPVVGGMQIDTPRPDEWPSDYDMEREARRRFGAARLGACTDSDNDVVTWLVVRA